MSVRLTEDQLRAVTTLDGDLVVRAGAGSGKTSVLAQRFAHAIATGVRGAPTEPDRLLTITFTSKAAAEIAERVRGVLRGQVSIAAARQVDQGWISTIHSFCARLVRRHVLELGLDTSFGQADEVTASAVRIEAFDRAARRGLERGTALGALFDTMSLVELRTRVVACHDKSRALGLNPREAVVPLDPDELQGLVEQVLFDAAELSRALEALRQTPSVESNRELLSEWQDGLASCSLDDEGCVEIIAACDEYCVRASGEARDANLRLKESLSRLRRAALAFRHAPEMKGIEFLVRAYAEEYRDLKAERGLLDFDDLQELAVSLLENDRD
jgi:superfamily I DNA/RNA helicase